MSGPNQLLIGESLRASEQQIVEIRNQGDVPVVGVLLVYAGDGDIALYKSTFSEPQTPKAALQYPQGIANMGVNLTTIVTEKIARKVGLGPKSFDALIGLVGNRYILENVLSLVNVDW